MLAIDQAARASGWSYWKNGKPVEWGVIEPSPKSLKGGERLTSLRNQFSELIDKYKPKIVLIEDPVGGQEDKIGPQQNWKTMQVLSQVQGVLLELISEKKKKVEICSPSSWQYTCKIHKRSRAERKAGAKNFVETEYKIKNVPQDVCDSICIGYHYLETNKKEVSAF